MVIVNFFVIIVDWMLSFCWWVIAVLSFNKDNAWMTVLVWVIEILDVVLWDLNVYSNDIFLGVEKVVLNVLIVCFGCFVNRSTLDSGCCPLSSARRSSVSMMLFKLRWVAQRPCHTPGTSP